MYKIVTKKELAPKIKLLEIVAPEIAAKAHAGQFLILRIDQDGERFPLTLFDWSKEKGTISIIFLEVGVSTEKLGQLKENDTILDVCGPLGKPSEIEKYNMVCVIGGGVGAASAYPIAKAFKEAGSKVVVIDGARTANTVILEDEFKKIANELIITTDDGTKGVKGFVNQALKSLVDNGYKFDAVYAIGPTVMMRAVANTTKPLNLKTFVSLNPIMVDGMGMCGACRVTVDGKTQFACVDGPDFDAHQVNFEELMERQKAFIPEEKASLKLLQEKHEKRCACEHK